MNEETEPATPNGLEEAPATFRSPAPTERPERPTWPAEKLAGEDLRGEDLTNMEGLLPKHLAGADLTGAKLPDDIAKFPALDQVAAISSEARKIFIGLLAACVYSWLVIGTTKDVQLIVNTATSPLPIINTPIPIAGFYVVGAALLAAVYCYLHFYLHHLWRTLATLPAFFPDGTALDDKSDPWLLTNFVRVYFQRLKPSRHPLKRLETSLSIALAWGLVPFTLFALWARYLPRHDWLGTGWLLGLTSFSVILGWHFFRSGRAALRGEALPPNGPGFAGTWRELRALSWAGRTFWLLAMLTPPVLAVCSYAAFHVNPRDDGNWAAQGLDGLELLGVRTYADLREANVAERPDGSDGKDWSKINRVDLRFRNLAFAAARWASLANVHLLGATLTGADLRSAELQGATLAVADLQGADLAIARLRGADLRGAQLQGADLRWAQLLGADLRWAQLQGAHLGKAQLQGADLRGAQLQSAHLGEAQLQGADLRGAQLQSAQLGEAQLPWRPDLRQAQAQAQDAAIVRYLQLQGVDISGAQLQSADLRGTKIWRANDALWDLADLRGSTVLPMTDSEIDALADEFTRGIPDGEVRKAAAERLKGRWRSAGRPPDFPEEWRSEPNVMFDLGDPAPEPFDWGPGKWATEQAYVARQAKLIP